MSSFISPNNRRQPNLSQETYTAALERGQELELEDVVAVLIEAHDVGAMRVFRMGII